MDGASYKLANTDRAVLWGITSSGGSYNSAGEHTGCGDATGDSKGGKRVIFVHFFIKFSSWYLH